jgi:hypothetical protein
MLRIRLRHSAGHQSFSPRAIPARPISRAPRAPNNNVFPFGNTTVPFRFSQIHDDVPAGLITGMRFRHNLTTTTYAAHSITIDAWMSTSLNASTARDTTFDNNHGRRQDPGHHQPHLQHAGFDGRPGAW